MHTTSARYPSEYSTRWRVTQRKARRRGAIPAHRWGSRLDTITAAERWWLRRGNYYRAVRLPRRTATRSPSLYQLRHRPEEAHVATPWFAACRVADGRRGAAVRHCDGWVLQDGLTVDEAQRLAVAMCEWAAS